MDSWLFDNVEDGTDDSESDSAETQAELEARLYSIVHHNDLSQPLPPELAKHYSVFCTDSGEVEVILKDSLEELKSEECEKVIQVPISSEFETEEIGKTSTTETVEDDDDIVIISESKEEAKNPNKRFRYSDINLDSSVESQNNTTTEFISSNSTFRLSEAILNHNDQKFHHLNIPTFELSDWKTGANANFISLGARKTEKKEIVKQMAQALRQVNPREKMDNLRRFAHYLYSRQVLIMRRKRNRENKKKRSMFGPTVPMYSSKETQNNNTPVREKINDNTSVSKKNKTKSKGKMNGSISLNISPFRPDTSTVDLTSGDKNLSHSKKKKSVNEMNLSKSSIPNKWSPRMIRFYTARPNKRMQTDLESILDHLKKTTIRSDWWMDERDRAGVYQHSLHGRSLKCGNCRETGHFTKLCPRPNKSNICILCGDHTHNKFSCPDKICMKCGMFVKNKKMFDDECSTCYYSAFKTPAPCSVCGFRTHQSNMCPDLWRSYHATTSGEKRIPHFIIPNGRNYCCNCGRKGHFVHECKESVNSQQQVSPFIANYSEIPSQTGTSEVVIPRHYAHIIESPEMDDFLQSLSNKIDARILCETDEAGYVLKISGTFNQCHKVKNELEDYVNVKKRKRREPPLPTIKRQRIK